MSNLSKLPFEPETVGANQICRYPLVVHAAKKRHPIQYRRIGTREWCDWDASDLSLHSPSFLHRSCDWRTKG